MRWVWFFGFCSLVLLTGLAVYLMPLRPNIVALQFTFSPEAFQAVLNDWQPEGVARFRAHLPIDGVLLLCYGAYGYLQTTRTHLFASFSDSARGFIASMLPLAAFFDAVENLMHFLLTNPGAPPNPPMAFYAGCSSTLKWTFLSLFLLCVIHSVGVVRWWKRH